ncbi:hypothetical protein GCM10007855_01970 [Aliivibrio sifiae]|uniref:Transposase n=1 Tax=Aliivibrio sifiae TaxID=566293 RepID=A0ABQ6AAQ9_9GAMM|nr:hypothetical protein GCM10007855_01970 [Aliivibrio sifiae]
MIRRKFCRLTERLDVMINTLLQHKTQNDNKITFLNIQEITFNTVLEAIDL